MKILAFLLPFLIIFFASFYCFFRTLKKSAKQEEKHLQELEQKALLAKKQKEKEIEKTDSTVLLKHSCNADYHSTKQAELKQSHNERVRARIRQKLQQ